MTNEENCHIRTVTERRLFVLQKLGIMYEELYLKLKFSQYVDEYKGAVGVPACFTTSVLCYVLWSRISCVPYKRACAISTQKEVRLNVHLFLL